MDSLTNYYNFLKENNINSVDSLKEFISKDIYRLKFKEDNQLILIYNDQTSNLTEDLVKFFNGVIIDKNTLKIVCYTFDKCNEENSINPEFINNDVMIHPVYEGTLIRLFYYNNEWKLATKKMINAFNAKWASEKSFGDMFVEIFGIENFNSDFIDSLGVNQNYCYSFLMGHNENNIIQNSHNYIIHLNSVDLINNNEVEFSFSKELIQTIKHINEYGSVMINLNQDELESHIKNIKNDTGLNEIGYMLINKNNGIKQKFMKNNYIEIRELWGNTNNRLFRYLHLRKNPDKLKKYLEIFKNEKQQLLDYENYLMNVATFILNIYRNRHISKQITKVPFYIRDIIYKIHGLYLQTKNKVSFQDINVILHDLDEKKFCYIINNIEKEKKKIQEEALKKTNENSQYIEHSDNINNVVNEEMIIDS